MNLETKEEPNPFEEAFFIKFDGSPIKKTVHTNNDNENVPPLVQLDLRFDLLRVFLEHIQKIVNQHDELLNSMQGDIKRRATENSLTEYFDRISEGLHKDWGERPHSLKLNDEANQFYQCDDSPHLRRSVDKLTGKLEIISVHLLNAANVSFLI